MPYLIDGHNLIAKLPGFDLSDPDDEAKLVLRLRGFAAARRKKCIVIFDKGLPGGQSALSNNAVHVVFATAFQTTADAIIMERIRNTPDAGNWTVVSSDNEVLAAARRHGMRAMLSSDFAQGLNQRPPAQQDIGERTHVIVAPQEVDEWLDIFGKAGDDNTDPPPQPDKKSVRPPAQPNHKPRKNGTASSNGHMPKSGKKSSNGHKPNLSKKLSTLGKSDDIHIPDDDVDAWLNYFSAAHPPKPEAAPTRKPPAPRPTIDIEEQEEEIEEAPPPPRKTKPPAPPLPKGKFDDEHISNAEIEEWLDIFTDFDDDDYTPPKPKKKR